MLPEAPGQFLKPSPRPAGAALANSDANSNFKTSYDVKIRKGDIVIREDGCVFMLNWQVQDMPNNQTTQAIVCNATLSFTRHVDETVDDRGFLMEASRFVNALNCFNASIALVESEKKKVDALRAQFGDTCRIYGNDFVSFSLQTDDSYDLVIGNPPYIAKKKVLKEEAEATQRLVQSFGLEMGVFQNLWVSFVLASIKVLSPEGAIFFVLPFEFLQIQYAEKLREFLEKRFNTIEIITFEKRVFEDIEQDICLVYMANETKAKSYVQYTTLTSANEPTQLFQSQISRNKPIKKWSYCILNDEETEKLRSLANKYPLVGSFGEISPGIVTGANSFFILPKMEMERLGVPDKQSR